MKVQYSTLSYTVTVNEKHSLLSCTCITTPPDQPILKQHYSSTILHNSLFKTFLLDKKSKQLAFLAMPNIRWLWGTLIFPINNWTMGRHIINGNFLTIN